MGAEEEEAADVEEEGEDEGPAAKKKRSSESHAMCVTGCGNAKVERSEAGEVEMSQICGSRKASWCQPVARAGQGRASPHDRASGPRNERTLTVESIEAVMTLQCGNVPSPTRTSVTASVWSDRVANGAGGFMGVAARRLRKFASAGRSQCASM